MKAARSKLAVFTLLMVGTACHSEQKPVKARVQAARVGNQPVYLDEVDQRAAEELFEIRSNALRRLVSDKLVRDEARKRNVTIKELWRIEVEEKVPAPDAAETAKALAEFTSSGKLTPQEAAQMTAEDASRRVRRLRLIEREGTFFDSLYASAAVQVDFAALGKPSLEITKDGPSVGPRDATLTLVEFADLTQSFTAMWQPTLEKLVGKYQSRVRFLFKQKPDRPDSASAKVAEAALCANDQTLYWEFRKALFHQHKPVGPESLTSAAEAAKLDMGRFEDCLSSGRSKQGVVSDLREATANRLEGEPVLSVNGIRVSGAQPFDAIDTLLKNEISMQTKPTG